jgi:hypothetical protein
MADIHFEQPAPVPLNPALDALGKVLRGIAGQEASWKGFALHANLGEAGLPDVGYIAVPIQLTIGESTPGINQIPIAIRAASHPGSFPVFQGAIAVEMSGNSASMFSLGGSYDVPLGVIGSLVNAALVRGLAERSLQRFLTDIAQACTAFVEKREADFMRYSVFHTW